MIGNTQPRRQMLTMNSPAAAIEMTHEQAQRGQVRVHVGVRRAVDEAAVRLRERELRQVVLDTSW